LIAFTSNERDVSPNRSKSVSEGAAMLGLFLYKHGIVREVYMKSTAFLTGQLLRISDELHALYGDIVRKDVPRVLVGSSMLTTASDMPDKALSQLSMRMSPYLTWARSYRWQNIEEERKESCRAKCLLDSYEPIAGQLYEIFTEPVRFNDFEKAQLFLGYLAAFNKCEASEKVINNKGEAKTQLPQEATQPQDVNSPHPYH
jgi:hypothetical protein